MLSAFSNISSQSDSIFTHFDEIIAFDKNAAFHHESVRILGNAFVGPEYQNSCSKGFVFEVASLLSKWSYPLSFVCWHAFAAITHHTSHKTRNENGVQPSS